MRRLNPAAILLHPLPRVDEIATDVDADPRAAYFRQAIRTGLGLKAQINHKSVFDRKNSPAMPSIVRPRKLRGREQRNVTVVPAAAGATREDQAASSNQ